MHPRRRLYAWTVLLLVMLPSTIVERVEAQRRAQVGLEIGRLAIAYGVEAGDPREELGAVTDAISGPNGVVFVLDRPLARVLMLDANGVFLASIGRPGDGPGEFRNPVALAVLSTPSQLVVLDQTQGRISFLGWQGGRLRYSGSIAVTPYAVDLCVMNNEIYIYAPSPAEETVVQVVDGAGHERRRFGRPFGNEGGMMMRMARRGARLACHQERNAVLLASELEGEILAYSAGGELLWSSRLKELITAKIRVSGNGFGFDQSTPQPWDLVDVLVPLSHNVLAVQVERAKRPPPAGESPGAIRRTILLSATDGSELGRVSQVPRILAVDGLRLLTSRDLPFPQLQVWSPVSLKP